MKLFYVDQFNKVQEFNGTDEEMEAMYAARNLYHTDWHAYEASQGRKTTYRSFALFSTGILDKWALTRTFKPEQVCYISDVNTWCNAYVCILNRAGVIFDTEEEARAASERVIAALRGEAEHRASTPKQSQAPQDGQHQPCSEEQQSQGESSCGRTTSNSGCKCHEQDHPYNQGRVKVTVIEMFL